MIFYSSLQIILFFSIPKLYLKFYFFFKNFTLDLLTAKETLLFYARLKGVKKSEENEHVEETLTAVGKI